MEHTDFNILAGKVLLALALVLAVAGQRKAEHGTAMLGFSVFLFGLAARQLENDYLHGWYPHTGWYLVMRLLLAGAALLAFVSLVSERRDRLVAAALGIAALAV